MPAGGHEGLDLALSAVERGAPRCSLDWGPPKRSQRSSLWFASLAAADRTDLSSPPAINSPSTIGGERRGHLDSFSENEPESRKKALTNSSYGNHVRGVTSTP
jgi:hypothetical protein